MSSVYTPHTKVYTKGKRKLKIVDKLSHRKPTKKGLNVVEKKQVASIINRKAETKYFKTAFTLVNQQLKFQSDVAGSQEICVRGFTCGPGQEAINNETYGYEAAGGAARGITPLFCARTFDASLTGNPNEAYSSNVPDGKYVNPSLSKCVWRLHRQKVDTSDANNERLAAPYIVRFIHVRPRASKFSDTTLIPREDLFVNNYGVAYGVDSEANDYQQNFGLFEMMTSKVNTRKYQVIRDTQCQLSAPLVSTQIDTDLLSTLSSGSNQKMFTTLFKQPKKLYYEGVYNTEASREPLAGQANDMIFIHVGILGTSTKGLLADLKIDTKPISTFRDV